jgi:ribulose kinase
MKNKAKAITTSIAYDHSTQHTLFRVFVGALIMLSIVYIYLIGSITFSVLARKSLETTVRNLGSQISELELTYLASANKIDKNYALSKGFVDSHQNIFATRATTRVAVR